MKTYLFLTKLYEIGISLVIFFGSQENRKQQHRIKKSIGQDSSEEQSEVGQLKSQVAFLRRLLSD